MKKRFISILVCVLCVVELCACCGQRAAAWQEQYDLGVRYLSEGNYEEAIIAFTAAIEIDPKQAPAYVGRGDAYIGSGETEENLASALADYEKALVLDSAIQEAYLGLAEIYIRRGDYKTAEEILQDGLKYARENLKLMDKLSELEQLMEESEADQIFTEDELKPEDLKIAGKPFWEATLEDVQAQFTYLDGDNEEIRDSSNDDAADIPYHGFYKDITNGKIGAIQNDRDSGVSHFWIFSHEDIPLDVREIHMGELCADVLPKFGLQESWIKDFLAPGPRKRFHLQYDGGEWTAYYGEADIYRFVDFGWINFPCETVQNVYSLRFELTFDENDKLITVLYELILKE